MFSHPSLASNRVLEFCLFRCERGKCNGLLIVRLARYQVDKEIPGASWVELPKGTYSIRSESKKRSRCQLEVDVFFNHMKSHPCKGEWNKVAPLRILSFDIECAGRKGHFPEVSPAYLTEAPKNYPSLVLYLACRCGRAVCTFQEDSCSKEGSPRR